ncbi:MAG: lysylphosphatidylglycerol synthase domain-containing protein [Bacteroidia bacterium]
MLFVRTFALKLYHSLLQRPQPESIGIRPGWVIKALVTVAVFSWVFFRLFKEGVSISSYVTQIGTGGLPEVLLAFAGMPLNLGLESLKWKFMIHRAGGNLSFLQAWKGVFAGLSTGIFTPNRIGEYAGRIAFLPPELRLHGAVFLFADRICQMIITVWMGTLAMEYFRIFHVVLISEKWDLPWPAISAGLWSISLLLPVAVLLMAVISRKLNLHKFRFATVQKLISALASLRPGIIMPVLGLGLFRYLVFSLQYFSLAIAFGYQGETVLLLAMIWMVFLVKSVIPSVTLTELGIRESVALAVMGVFGVPAHIAFSATFVLYVVNIIVPSLSGLYYVYRLKI